MKLSEIRDCLDAIQLTEFICENIEIEAAGATDLTDDILAAISKGCVLLTGTLTIEMIQTSKMVGVSAIVYVRGKQPDKEAISLAKSYNIPLLSSPHSMFVSCGRLYMEGLRGLDGSW